MGRIRVAKKAASVSPIVSSSSERRSSSRLRQLKLHEVKVHEVKEQKLSNSRRGAGKGKPTGKGSRKSSVETVDLEYEVSASKKAQSSKKLKSGIQRSWSKLSDEQKEKILKSFDLNLEYGPCCGISRTDRLRRARGFGLEVEECISYLLDGLTDPASPSLICLWDRPNVGSI